MNDATLVQLIDGALDRNAATRVESHLAHCDACERRHRTVRRRAARLQAVYGAVTPAAPALPDSWIAPAHRASRPKLSVASVAAAAAVLLVTSLLVSPVYAYLSRWMAERTAGVHRAADPPPPPAVPATIEPHQEPPASAVRFKPLAEEITIRFASSEPGALLEVRDTPLSDVAIEAGGKAGEERPVLVLPSALEVENAGRSGGIYRIWVPASVKRLRVEVAGRVLSTVVTGAPAGGATRKIELRR